MKLNQKLVKDVLDSRPIADHAIRQYLMTYKSVQAQLEKYSDRFYRKRAIFIGDDDNYSILLNHFFKTDSLVLEIDERIIENQKNGNKNLA